MDSRAALLLVLFLALLAGCSGVRTTSPEVRAEIPGLGSFAHEGDAETPGSVDIERGETSLEIPAGTPVTIDAAGVVTFTPAAPVKLSGVRFAASLHGPKAFAPPAPPSPAEEARGFGVRAFYLAALLCALAAGFCVWRGYPLAAICCGAAALALPILANFFGGMSATVAGVACVALAAGLVVAYKLTTARRDAAGVSSDRAVTAGASQAAG